MPLGYRAEGITHSAPMAADHVIAKGDAVAFDDEGFLVRAPADEKDPMGVAVESCTSKAGEHPWVGYMLHGIAGVRASAAVSAGQAVMVGPEPGQVVPMADQAVDEAGAAAYTIRRNQKLGRALKDIAAGEVGDVFVTA